MRLKLLPIALTLLLTTSLACADTQDSQESKSNLIFKKESSGRTVIYGGMTEAQAESLHAGALGVKQTAASSDDSAKTPSKKLIVKRLGDIRASEWLNLSHDDRKDYVEVAMLKVGGLGIGSEWSGQDYYKLVEIDITP